MIKRIFVALCFLFLLPGFLMAQSFQSHQPYIDLHYHFKVGDEYQIHQNSEKETYLSIKGVPQRTSTKRNSILLLTVKQIEPSGTAKIEASFKKIFLMSNQKNNTVTINTQSKGKDIYNKLFKALVNKTFTLEMKPNGEITGIEGLDTIFSQMIAALPDVKKKDVPKLKAFLSKQMGPSSVKTNLSMVLANYPSFKVRKGGTWTSHLKTKSFYDGRIDNYWELTFGTKYIAKLKSTGKFNTNPSKVVNLGVGQKGRMDMNGDIDGKFIVNPVTSWPLRSLIHAKYTGNFTLFVMKRGKKKGEITVPVKIISNASYQVKHL